MKYKGDEKAGFFHSFFKRERIRRLKDTRKTEKHPFTLELFRSKAETCTRRYSDNEARGQLA